MLVQMHEARIRTLEDVEQFLVGTTSASLKLQGSKDDVYAWIQHTLVRFRYMVLVQEAKGADTALYQANNGVFPSTDEPADKAIPQNGSYPAQAAYGQRL